MTTATNVPDSRTEADVLWFWNDAAQAWEYRTGERWAFVREREEINRFYDILVFARETDPNDESSLCEFEIVSVALLIPSDDKSEQCTHLAFNLAVQLLKEFPSTKNSVSWE